MIDDEEFAAEVRADLAVERGLFWRGVASVGMVVLMLVLRTLLLHLIAATDRRRAN